jgi:hypothetical protein
MNLNKELKHPKYEKFLNWYATGKYSNKAIVDCSRGEIREALSYFISDENSLTVTDIVKSIRKNIEISWKDLDLLDEAILTKELRNLGYDPKLVDQFPNNSRDLLKVCLKLPYLTIIKNSLRKAKSKIHNLVIYWYFIFICLGITVYFDLLLSIYSLIFTWCIWALTEVPKHDYIEHNYIIPKNKIIKYIIDFVLSLLNPEIYADKENWQKMHDLHHKNWQSELDTLTRLIDQGIILAMIKHKPFVKPNSLALGKILSLYPEFPWLFKHLIKIKVLISIILLLLLGPQLFLYFVAIPAALKLGFEGQHDWYIIRFGERNYWFMWPLALNQAWHLKHHQSYNRAPNTWNDIFQGPKWVRYVNPQYYLTRLLFKINRPI